MINKKGDKNNAKQKIAELKQVQEIRNREKAEEMAISSSVN